MVFEAPWHFASFPFTKVLEISYLSSICKIIIFCQGNVWRNFDFKYSININFFKNWALVGDHIAQQSQNLNKCHFEWVFEIRTPQYLNYIPFLASKSLFFLVFFLLLQYIFLRPLQLRIQKCIGIYWFNILS